MWRLHNSDVPLRHPGAMCLALRLQQGCVCSRRSGPEGGEGDASTSFSATCTFCKEAKAFSETTATTSFYVPLVRTETRGHAGCKAGLERNICLFVCLFVFPGFCSGRQTRGKGTGNGYRVPELPCRVWGTGHRRKGDPQGRSAWPLLARAHRLSVHLACLTRGMVAVLTLPGLRTTLYS